MIDREPPDEIASTQRDAVLAAVARRDWPATIHAARAALGQPGAQDDRGMLRALAQAAGELEYYGEAIAANARIRALTLESDLGTRMALLGEQRRLRDAQLRHEIENDYEVERATTDEDWEQLTRHYVPLWEMERFDEAVEMLRAITADARATAAHWCLRARMVRLTLPGEQGEAELRECVATALHLAPGDAMAAVVGELLRAPAPADGLPPWMEDLGFEIRQINGVEVVYPPLCEVPAGRFEMGSDPAADADAYPDEYPHHSQELGAYAIGRFPVTVAEYARFLAHTGRRAPVRWRTQLNRPDTPVTQVSWHDAHAYGAWLTEQTGEAWRLPSEAEWEKAARWDAAAEHAGIYPWGDGFDPARANTLMTPARMVNGVGAFPAGASPCGAREMTGNVWEWTSSAFAPYPYAASDGREDGEPTADRVVRGGAWTYLPPLARGACRAHRTPIDYGDGTGFRLVRGSSNNA